MHKTSVKRDYEDLMKECIQLRHSVSKLLDAMQKEREFLNDIKWCMENSKFEVEQRFGLGGDILRRKK